MTVKIKISHGHSGQWDLLARQTPSFSGRWRNAQFVGSDYRGPVDWWVVLHSSGLSSAESTLVDPRNIVFVSMEPSVWGRPDQFLRQFPVVISVDRSILSHQNYYMNCHTWWSGLEVDYNSSDQFKLARDSDYDSYQRVTSPSKTKLISVITSSKKIFPGHKRRTEFLEKILSHKISRYIDVFGFGRNEIKDKADGLWDYKYHICLENCIEENYWSEKLADPFLNFCYPIYYGCPNISDFFDSRSFCSFNLGKFENFIEMIERILDEDRYSNALPYVVESRFKILNDYNIFNTLFNLCNKPASTFNWCTLYPPMHFTKDSSIISRGRHMLRRNFILR
ncbi:hypothetical protein I3V23_04180 [Rhodobacterales bacterium HKCCA1288]|nr:hypothetical protein I3V23_04180 [Rhodobacterales bacterium HKCCA1288]